MEFLRSRTDAERTALRATCRRVNGKPQVFGPRSDFLGSQLGKETIPNRGLRVLTCFCQIITAKLGFDTAENEPRQVCCMYDYGSRVVIWSRFQPRSQPIPSWQRPQSAPARSRRRGRRGDKEEDDAANVVHPRGFFKGVAF